MGHLDAVVGLTKASDRLISRFKADGAIAACHCLSDFRGI